jgi:hypothetical protein
MLYFAAIQACLGKIILKIFNNDKGYEGVEPYIYDLQSKCIALCNIPFFM